MLESGISEPRCFEFNSREGVLSAVAAGIGISAIFDEGLLPEDRSHPAANQGLQHSLQH